MTQNRLIEELSAALGENTVKFESADLAPYISDWRGRYKGVALCVVEPNDTQGVSRVVHLAAAHGAKIVPQGGNTGLVGGAVPGSASMGTPEVVLSLRRLNRVRDVDPIDNVIVAEAGVVVQVAQDAAKNAGRLLPISLAAEGSAQIGGVVSTNAGGTNVLRYGNTRDLVLGLEVVLADGTIWNGLRRLHKDNTGYDLKQLFIGAEGTLGVITAATIKLFPMPHACATAFVAVPSPDAAVRLLRHLQSDLGDCLTAFELMERGCLDLVLDSNPDARDPLPTRSPWYVLAEVSTLVRGLAIDARVEECLASAFELGFGTDAVMAQSEAQRVELWRLREEISESERRNGPSAKHDISIAVSRLPDFLMQAPIAVLEVVPDARPIAFGHVGDGNIHFNVLAPAEAAEIINAVIYDLVTRLGGSISAEHGIGQAKVELLERHKDHVSLSIMRQIRATLDPTNIFNPGKLFAVPSIGVSKTD